MKMDFILNCKYFLTLIYNKFKYPKVVGLLLPFTYGLANNPHSKSVIFSATYSVGGTRWYCNYGISYREMLAAIARKDYEDLRRRQPEGISKAKSEG